MSPALLCFVLSKLQEFLNNSIWLKLPALEPEKEWDSEKQREREREWVRAGGVKRGGAALDWDFSQVVLSGIEERGALKLPFRGRESPPSGRVFSRPRLRRAHWLRSGRSNSINSAKTLPLESITFLFMLDLIKSGEVKFTPFWCSFFSLALPPPAGWEGPS